MNDIRINVQASLGPRALDSYKDSKKSEKARSEKQKDVIELSDNGRLLNAISKTAPLRMDKVEEVLQEIKTGSYVNDAKMTAALEEILEEI